MWWGGFSIGPRYILPGLPFMTIAMVFPLRQWLSHNWFKLLAGLLYAWSLVATWGLTLAGQAFPSDIIKFPLQNYALPRWQAGDIARNLGTIIGVQGVGSIIIWMVILTGMLIAWWMWVGKKGTVE